MRSDVSTESPSKNLARPFLQLDSSSEYLAVRLTRSGRDGALIAYRSRKIGLIIFDNLNKIPDQ